MIWNTIVHPKVMIDSNPGGGEPAFDPDDTIGSVVEGIKYADPHKLAFFDLLVDATDDDNPKLIHGDFETVKNKILNHELVIGGETIYDTRTKDPSVSIEIGGIIEYKKLSNIILFHVLRYRGTITYVVSSDNTVSIYEDDPASQ